MKLRHALPTVVLFFVAAPARAEQKDACITAYEQTQTLRKDGKLVEAKAQAAVCAREACPAILSKDCSKWLVDIEATTPSIVLEVRTAAGVERTDVKVTIDGAPLAERLDGKSIPIDPGAHTLRFEPDGGATFEKAIVAHEGDKHRRVKVTIPEEASPAASTATRPIPVGVWLFGAASVVALGTSAAFAIDGLSRKSTLDDCKPRCAPSDVDAMSARFTVADVALGAGIGLGAAALWLFFTRPEKEPRPVVAPSVQGVIVRF